MKTLLLAICVVLVGCSAKVEQPDCVTEATKDVVVAWGNVYEDGSVRGYEILSSASLSSFDKTSVGEEATGTREIGRLDNDEYCAAVAKVRETFRKVQVLHSPGERSRYIEFSNHRKGVYLRALWNPAFQNAGNEEFSKLYAYLESLGVVD